MHAAQLEGAAVRTETMEDRLLKSSPETIADESEGSLWKNTVHVRTQ